MQITLIILGIYLGQVLLVYRLMALNDKYYLKWCDISRESIKNTELCFIDGKLEYSLNAPVWVPILQVIFIIFAFCMLVKWYFKYQTINYRKEGLRIKILGKEFNLKNPLIAIWTFWVVGRNHKKS